MKLFHRFFSGFLQILAVLIFFVVLYINSGYTISDLSVSDLSASDSSASDNYTESEQADNESTTPALPKKEKNTCILLQNPDTLQTALRRELSKQYLFCSYDLPAFSDSSHHWTHLEKELNTLLGEDCENWSIYVKDMTNGKIININQQSMESASLIKLYIMGSVFEQIEDGHLKKNSSIDRLLDNMITVSDNDSSNDLVSYLGNDNHKNGMQAVNEFMKRHGYLDSKMVNGLGDSDLWYVSTESNVTSARDCGEFLSDVYEGNLVSHLASRKMETLLMNQNITYKIPEALPDEAIVANKTGEMDFVENDAAIIYTNTNDFILCILSNRLEDEDAAVEQIHNITKLVYEYFSTIQSHGK